jgi:protein-tyrosine phosphatase
MSRTVLFLCTGNYYRSRFAEHLFNHLAARDGLNWRADSRGLAVELAATLPGTISLDTVRRLVELEIACGDNHRKGVACHADDLSNADFVVAVKEAEHRPLLAARHPGWESKVIYWHVHDLDAATPTEALAEIERLVGQLVEDIKHNKLGAK